MSGKISIPAGSGFDGDVAIELLHLIDRVYSIYEEEKKDNSTGLYPDKITSCKTYIKNESDPEYKYSEDKRHLPQVLPNNIEYMEYDISKLLKIDEDFHKISSLKEGEYTIGLILNRKNINGHNIFYVVFRGTQEDVEWVQNSKIDQESLDSELFKKPDKEIFISKGFQEMYEGSSDEKLKTIKRYLNIFMSDHSDVLCDSNTKIYVCGHSLGGALATIAALHIGSYFDSDKVKPIVYTFASPKVGNQKFAELITSCTDSFYRVANTEDLVTCIPFSMVLDGEEMKKDTQIDSFSTLTIPEISPYNLLTITRQKSENNIINKLEETMEEMKNKASGAEKFSRIFFNLGSGFLSKSKYYHVGKPILFEDNTGAITTNHNLYITYRDAIYEGWKEHQECG